jgi:PAS domain S-box-containing protein
LTRPPPEPTSDDVPAEAGREDLLAALDKVNVPTGVVDLSWKIRWLNDAARRVLGDVVGQSFESIVAPDYVPLARDQFLRKLDGTPVTDYELAFLDRSGRAVLAELSSVPLRADQRIVGIFGLAQPRVSSVPARPADDPLTRRQHEVLRLLADGASSKQIASALHISAETARNHARHILRALGVHSRLEAVAKARRLGLLDD